MIKREAKREIKDEGRKSPIVFQMHEENGPQPVVVVQRQSLCIFSQKLQPILLFFEKQWNEPKKTSACSQWESEEARSLW